MHMRPSKVLRKLRRGELVSSFYTKTSSAVVAEIAAFSGFDCIWIDMEHTAIDWSALEKQVMAAKLYDVDTVVRVPRGSYSDYIKPLEIDATGIMVPHLLHLEDSLNIVRMTRFPPLGRRALDGGSTDGAYCNISIPDYVREANQERFVIVQVEDPETMEDLDEICAVEGIDMIFFGPGDYSSGLGVPGEVNDPRVLEARTRVAETARAHGKFAGTVGGPDALQGLVESGYQFVVIGADVVGLSRYCQELVAQFAKYSTLAGT